MESFHREGGCLSTPVHPPVLRNSKQILGGKLGAGLPVQAHREYNADEAWMSRKVRFFQPFRCKCGVGAMQVQCIVASFESLPLR